MNPYGIPDEVYDVIMAKSEKAEPAPTIPEDVKSYIPLETVAEAKIRDTSGTQTEPTRKITLDGNKKTLEEFMERGGPMGLGIIGTEIADYLKDTPIGAVTEPFRGALASVRAGFAGANEEFNRLWFDYTPDKTRWNSTSDYYKEVAKSHGIDPDSVAGKVYQGLGSAPMGIAQFLANIPYSATSGAVEAHRTGKNPFVGAVKGAVERLLLGKLFHYIESAGLSPAQSRAALGTIFAAQSATSGGDVEDIASSAIVGGILGGGRDARSTELFNTMVKEGVPHKQASEILKQYSTYEQVQRASLEDPDSLFGQGKKGPTIEPVNTKDEPTEVTKPKSSKADTEIDLDKIEEDLKVTRESAKKRTENAPETKTEAEPSRDSRDGSIGQTDTERVNLEQAKVAPEEVSEVRNVDGPDGNQLRDMQPANVAEDLANNEILNKATKVDESPAAGAAVPAETPVDRGSAELPAELEPVTKNRGPITIEKYGTGDNSWAVKQDGKNISFWPTKQAALRSIRPAKEKVISPDIDRQRKSYIFKSFVKANKGKFSTFLGERLQELIRKRKIDINEKVVRPDEPVEIGPTASDSTYRHTFAVMPDGSIREGKSGSYDSILNDGVAGRQAGTVPPGATLYVIDIDNGYLKFNEVNIFRSSEAPPEKVAIPEKAGKSVEAKPTVEAKPVSDLDQKAFDILRKQYPEIKVSKKEGGYAWRNTKDKTQSAYPYNKGEAPKPRVFDSPLKAFQDAVQNRQTLTLDDYPPIPDGTVRYWKLKDGTKTTNATDIDFKTNPPEEVGYIDMAGGKMSYTPVESRIELLEKAAKSAAKHRIPLGLSIIDINKMDRTSPEFDPNYKRSFISRLYQMSRRRSLLDFMSMRENEDFAIGGPVPTYEITRATNFKAGKTKLNIPHSPQEATEIINLVDKSVDKKSLGGFSVTSYPYGATLADNLAGDNWNKTYRGSTPKSRLPGTKAHERVHMLFNKALWSMDRMWDDLFHIIKGNEHINHSLAANPRELQAEAVSILTRPEQERSIGKLPEIAFDYARHFTKPRSFDEFLSKGDKAPHFIVAEGGNLVPQKLLAPNKELAIKLADQLKDVAEQHGISGYTVQIVKAVSPPQVTWPSIRTILNGLEKYIGDLSIGLSVKDVSKSTPEELAQSRLFDVWSKIMKAAGEQDPLLYAQEKLGIEPKTAASLQDAFIREFAKRSELLKEAKEAKGIPYEPSLPAKAGLLKDQLGMSDSDFEALKLKLTGKTNMTSKAEVRMTTAEKKVIVAELEKQYQDKFDSKYEYEIKYRRKRKPIEAIVEDEGIEGKTLKVITHGLRMAVASGKDWLDKTKTGKLVGEALNTIINNSTLLSGKYLGPLYRNKRMLSKYNDQVFDLLNSGKTWTEIFSETRDPNLIKLLTQYRNTTEAVANMAVDRGIKVMRYSIEGGKVKITEVPFEFDSDVPYYPRIYPADMFSSNKRVEAAINSLMKPSVHNPKGRTRREAIKLFNVIAAGRHGMTRNPNLEYARMFDVDGYEKNVLTALTLYTTQASKRLYATDYFGFDGKKLSMLLDRIEKEGGDKDIADHVISSALGQRRQENRMLRKLSDIAVTFQVLKSMGLSVLPQVSQIGYVYEETNLRTMVKTIGQFLKADTREESLSHAYSTGVILASLIKEHMDMLQGDTVADRFLQKSGFLPVDRFNRIFASVAGKEYAKILYDHYLKTGNKTAEHRLNLLGIDAKSVRNEGRSVLSEDELRLAGLEMSNLTQYRSNSLTIPVPLTGLEIMGKNVSSVMRIITLFHTFAYHRYKQLERRFNNDPVFFAQRLIPTLVSMGVSGALVQELRDFLRGNKARKNQSDLARIGRYMAASGGVGILSDAVQQSISDQSGLSKFVSGIVVSDISKYFYDGFKAVETGNVKPLGKDLVGLAPVAIAPFSPGAAALTSGIISPRIKNDLIGPTRKRGRGRGTGGRGR